MNYIIETIKNYFAPFTISDFDAKIFNTYIITQNILYTTYGFNRGFVSNVYKFSNKTIFKLELIYGDILPVEYTYIVVPSTLLSILIVAGLLPKIRKYIHGSEKLYLASKLPISNTYIQDYIKVSNIDINYLQKILAQPTTKLVMLLLDIENPQIRNLVKEYVSKCDELDLGYLDKNGFDLLSLAVKEGLYDIVEKLIVKCGIFGYENMKQTPLVLAIKNDDIQMVNLILAHIPMWVTYKNSRGKSVIDSMFEIDNMFLYKNYNQKNLTDVQLKILELLLDNGARLEAKVDISNFPNAVPLLLHYGTNTILIQNYIKICIIYGLDTSIKSSDYSKDLAYLIVCGYPVNTLNVLSMCLWHEFKKFKKLCDLAISSGGETQNLLLQLLQNDTLDMPEKIKYLLDHNANVNVKTIKEQSILELYIRQVNNAKPNTLFTLDAQNLARIIVNTVVCEDCIKEIQSIELLRQIQQAMVESMLVRPAAGVEYMHTIAEEFDIVPRDFFDQWYIHYVETIIV